MESLHLFYLLRRRWLVLFVCAAVGAVAGFATVLVGDDDAPLVDYWTAGQILVAEPGVDLDLVRIAPLAVLGDTAEAAAADLGADLESLGLRVVSNTAEATLTISAVHTDPSDALTAAQTVADAFATDLDDAGRSAYESAVEEARNEVATLLDELTEAQGVLDLLNRNRETDEQGNLVELTPREADQLRRATIERDTASASYAGALQSLDELERQGPPTPPLRTLQQVPAYLISEASYFERIAEATTGANSFTSADVRDTPPRSQASSGLDNPAVRAAFGALAGLLAGIMGVVTHVRLDTRLRTRNDIERAYDLPVLVEVPVMKRREQRENVLHSLVEPYSKLAEAHRYLRSVLLFARAIPDEATSHPAGHEVATNGSTPPPPDTPRDVRVVMVTSAGAGEGKTTTAANLAVMMAEAGYETILMNCDHRRPRVHELFGVPYAPATVTPTPIACLHLVTDVSRGENESPAVLSDRQRKVITNARDDADIVILDTAPILATNDALDLLSVTDLVILVAKEGKSTAGSAAEARELLIDRMGMPVAGVVVTAAGAGLGTRYYEGYRYGGYYDRRTIETLESGVADTGEQPPRHAALFSDPGPTPDGDQQQLPLDAPGTQAPLAPAPAPRLGTLPGDSEPSWLAGMTSGGPSSQIKGKRVPNGAHDPVAPPARGGAPDDSDDDELVEVRDAAARRRAP